MWVSVATSLALLGAPLIAATSAYAAPPPAGYNTAKIKSNPYNSELGTIPIRQGYWDSNVPNAGFGFDKAVHKHNITSLTALNRLAASTNVYYQSGTDNWRLTTYTAYYTCSGSTCTATAKRTVRFIYNDNSYTKYSGWPVGGKLGLQTAYCDNPDGAFKCPSWVTNAIVNPGQSAAQAAPGSGEVPEPTPQPSDGTIGTSSLRSEASASSSRTASSADQALIDEIEDGNAETLSSSSPLPDSFKRS